MMTWIMGIVDVENTVPNIRKGVKKFRGIVN
jgi:hypothetical protein